MEIHHCFHCGTEAQPTWRFCRRCGTGLADVEQVARVARCGNCATELADGWRFCPNCGTSSDTATPQQGLSADDVAELIATPEAGTAETTMPVVDDATRFEDDISTIPEVSPTDLEPVFGEPHPAPLEPATEYVSDFDEPAIDIPEVGFEPVAGDAQDLIAGDITAGDLLPPAPGYDLETEPPAPPLDPMLTVAEIEARLLAEQSAPPADDFDEGLKPEIVDDAPLPRDWDSADEGLKPEIVDDAPLPRDWDSADEGLKPEIVDDAPLPRDWDSAGDTDAVADPARSAFEVHREPAGDIADAARGVTDAAAPDEKPAVVIPPARTGGRPEVRTELPTPIGSPRQPAAEIPRPIEPEARSTWSPTAPRKIEEPAGELPPTDRLFQDPGLLGQSTQLALLATAAISVAMVIAHIVLNNRLTDYAETGESIPRVESVQSIIGTWLRPLLIVALLLTYLMTVVWGRRIVANLAVFDKPVPEAAPWMWAIPLVNILVVQQHFDNAWKGSDALIKDDPDWKKSRGNWWTLGFTVLAVATAVVLFYGAFVVDSQTVEASMDSNAFLMIGYALLAASLLCLVRSIGGIIERQHNRARHFV